MLTNDSLSLPLEWTQVTHIPTSIKMAGAYNPEKSSYSTFARQLCDDTRLPGWFAAFPVHSQTFKPTQASFAHTNSQRTLFLTENLGRKQTFQLESPALTIEVLHVVSFPDYCFRARQERNVVSRLCCARV